jgi:septal ring factor EnvC (AmiA/AmiB activator)
MAHRIADSQQEIEQLKARQAQILLDNSELDRRLKETRELVRNNSDLINDLKSTQAQITQENADLAAQVKTGQEQVSMLAVQLDIAQTQIAKGASQSKVSPDRNVRLVEQKQRSKPPIPRAARANDPAKQLAPKPRLRPARPQPQTEVPAEAQ